jgi:hypothetical protein
MVYHAQQRIPDLMRHLLRYSLLCVFFIRLRRGGRFFKTLSSAVALVLVSGLLGPVQPTSSGGVQVDLQYQKRGDRFEGIKPKPVSGGDVELISALVDFRERVDSTPPRFRLRFFLERPQKVYLTVRELDYKHYYWLDQVQPKVPWQPGFENIFEWSTIDVIQKLNQLDMYDLGAVARLQKPTPSMVESVAPLIFYHSQAPHTIDGYLFTFKTNGDVRLTSSVYREGEAKALSTQIFRRQRGGRPFTVRWESSQAEKGYYRLMLEGYFLSSNDPINQTVRFFHQPRVKLLP